MTTTTTTAGVTAADGGGGGPAASPPNLIAVPPQNGHRVMPMGSRPNAGEESRRSPITAAEQPPRPPFLIDVAIRCTVPSCSCDCFSPCKSQIRTCDSCGHGWVSHALDKLGFRHLFNCHQVELVQPSIAFDVASLMLYGTQAIPVRLKILLDRLFSVLRQDEVLQVLHGFGWTNEDYSRGYIVQNPSGRVLERWLLASREEEPLILQQFLRFGETKPIAQQLLLQESCERPEFIINSPRTESDIKKFIERTNRSVGNTNSVKQNSHVYSASTTQPVIRPTFRQPSSSVSSTHSMSPSAVSPVNNCSSPVSLSPLNRLQNMQPSDYRRERSTSEPRTSEPANVNTNTSSVMYSSPSSSPRTSTLAVSTSSATSVNPISSLTRYNPGSPDFSAGDDMEASEDEDSSSAINLTRSNPTTGYLDSIFAAKKVRHLRKSANPMKRRWNTMVLSTLSTNPSTGKKRVQCHVCLKTFCDKGALKIHFSAVHLREMHKCTVEGCSMMFSSRRSRNRHSANPNPKLHTPNYRRKVNPHDGRSANPYPLIPPTGIHGYNSSLMPGPMANHFDGDSNSASEADVGQTSFMKCLDYHSSSKEEARNSSDDHKEITIQSEEKVEDMPLSLIKKRRLEEDNNAPDELEGIDLSVKEDRISSSSKGVRKRKSNNPTKCQVNSDDDLQYVSTDDSSSDTYIDQDNGENGQIDSKSDYLSSDGLDSKYDDDDDEDDDDDLDIADTKPNKPVKSEQVSVSSSPPSQSHPVVTTTPSVTPNISSLTKYLNEKQNGCVRAEMDALKKEVLRNRMHEMEDISENPLRHLESLSLGSFASIMNTSRSNFNRSANVSSGVSYHAPGLGLGSSVITTTAPIRVDSPPIPQTDHMTHLLNHTSAIVSPPSSQQLSGGHVNSDPENSLQEQQMPLLPVYRDASIVGSLEIPVDKENPRRCTACGKIFQNHFGVKTHYQNVHLKLMHKCTVEGCNAAFPSKRSRDRHSANLNLHRKLLSTTSEKPPSYFDKGAIYPYPPEAALRGDFFSRLYDPQSLPLSFADIYHSRLSTDSGFLAGSQYPGPLIPSFHPALIFPQTTTASHSRRQVSDDVGSGRDSPISSSSSPALSPQPRQHSPQREPSVKLEEDLRPDCEGRYSCDICEKKFHESIVLREHYEKCHSNSLLKCVEDGCNKVFLSGRTRNLHTDELHKNQIIEAS